MTARLRRILVSALLGLLVGLGAVAALLTGRRPAGRGAAIAPRADATARAGTVLGPVAGPVAGAAPSTRPGGTPRARRAGRGRTAALVGLVLVAGLVAALSGVGGAFPGLLRPTGDGAAKPLAALSPPATSPPAASPLQSKAPSASEPLPDGGIGRRPDPRAQAPAGSAAPTGSENQAAPAPAERDAPAAPSFDSVRVEPSGDAVIAGRAAPNAIVDLLVDGRPAATVMFSVPDPARDDGVTQSAAREAGTSDAGRRPSPGAAGAQSDPAAGPDEPPQASSTGTLAANGSATAPMGAAEVHIPGISTARIVRGDSLWKISRRTYGEGGRYTVIYGANQDQIRDPDLIYPGQIFVLPREEAARTDGDGWPR